MAFPNNMINIRFNFNFVYITTAVEIQDTGLWVTALPSTTPDPTDWQDACDGLAGAAAAAWVGRMNANWFSPAVVGTTVKTYRYGVDHTAHALTVGQHPFSGDDAWAGGGGGNGHAPQASVVASLYGYDPAVYTTQRGRKRGRMYLPTPSVSFTDTYGEVASGRQSDLANAVEGLVHDLVGYTFETGPGEIVSFVPTVASVAGQMATPITHIRVGKIVDTQRRRRNKLQEQYVTVPLS